jgi:hypothetical protein
MRLGMRAGYGYRALNENLAPLRRYLHALIGRPWNNVFNEICSGIDRRNTVQQHIHQHIRDFIAIDVDVRNGRLVDFAADRRFLWSAQRRQREQLEIAARRRMVDERTMPLLLDDVWFRVEVEALPKKRLAEGVVDGQARPRQTSPRSEIRRRFLQPLQLLLPALTFRRVALEHGGRLRQDERERTACSSRLVCDRQIIHVNDTVNVRAMIFCQLPFVPDLFRRMQEFRQGFAQATGAANRSPNRPISARASRLVKAARDDLQAVCIFLAFYRNLRSPDHDESVNRMSTIGVLTGRFLKLQMPIEGSIAAIGLRHPTIPPPV